MKKKLFIIGGAGNVYFQQLYMKINGYEYSVSELLISKKIRNMLGHTHHELAADRLLNYQRSERFFINIVFVLDLCIGFLFRKTLFTIVDLRSLKTDALLKDFFYVGYFQEDLNVNFQACYGLIKENLNCDAMEYDLCIHIRGGDFIKSNSQLTEKYYRASIELMKSKVDMAAFNVVIVTNDISFAKLVLQNVSLGKTCRFIKGNAVDDLSIMMTSKNLISSNSTFALMAAIEGNNKNIIILPKELLNKFCMKYDPESIFFL